MPSMDNQTPCPQCGWCVQSQAACPGFYQNGKWGFCIPACGEATLFECVDVKCGWWFIDGMSKRNHLYLSNEARRPEWLDLCAAGG
jgi:hypothetical protein